MQKSLELNLLIIRGSVGVRVLHGRGACEHELCMKITMHQF